MFNYAVIENNVVSNIVVANAQYAASQPNWVLLPDGVQRFWHYDGTSFTPPPVAPEPEQPTVQTPSKEELINQVTVLSNQITALQEQINSLSP